MMLLLEVLKDDPIRTDEMGFIKAAVDQIKGRLTAVVI